MNRERALGGFAVVLVVFAAGVAALAPGAMARGTDEDVRPSSLDLLEPRVSAGEVSGETATVSLDVRLEHRGGPAENVTVEVQAIDRATNLVESTVRKSIGTVTGDREVRTLVNLSVARQGGYEFAIRVYEDGKRVATGSTTVRGVGSLTPAYARTGVTFQGFESASNDLPSITFSIGETANNRTTLETRTYLTNGGDEPTEGVELLVRARQTDSNIVADRERVDVGTVDPGQTVTPTAALNVPDNYNYHLDAILLKDGVVVETATAAATLDPSLPTPENGSTQSGGLQTGDFQQGSAGGDEGANTPTDTEVAGSGGGGPGFGVTVALVAVFAAAVLAIRTRRQR